MDFYNVKKIDNHIHHSAAMSASHLLRFIQKKAKTEPHTRVLEDKKKGRVGDNALTLEEVFEDLGVLPENVSVDML